MSYTPSTLQSGSTALQTASRTDGRTAGLGLVVTAAPWPRLGLSQGVAPSGIFGATPFAWGPAGVDLGAIELVSNPAHALGSETSDWATNALPYGSNLTVSVSRCSPAVAVDTADTGVRLFAGNVSGYTLSGGGLTPRASAIASPRYVAYHTSGSWVVRALTGSDFTFPALDSPHLLLWWGNASYWCDSLAPHLHPFGGWQGWLGGGITDVDSATCFQADVPQLLAFTTTPTAIRQDLTNGGVVLTFASGAATLWTIQPLFGRTPQHATATETAGAATSLPTGAAAALNLWAGYTGYWPRTVAETSSYNSGTDTVTFTETFTWRTVHGTGAHLAPLPPWLALVNDGILSAPLMAPTLQTPTLTDLNTPTDWGPYTGVAGSGTPYAWSVAGSAAYLPATRTPGAGSVPAWLSALITAEWDKWQALGHCDPWFAGERMPISPWGGHTYWADAGDALVHLAEVRPFLDATRQGQVDTLLASERTTYQPEIAWATVGTGSDLRGRLVAPQQSIFGSNQYPNYLLGARPDLRPVGPPLWNLYGLARYYQVTGTTPTSGVRTAVQTVCQDRLAERDWASGAAYDGHRQKRTAVEDANRDLAGVGGAVVLHTLGGDTTTANLLRAAWVRLAILRLGMARYPRWLAAAGQIVLPASADWQLTATQRVSHAPSITVPSWTGSPDDTRQVYWCDQFGVRLADHNGEADVGATVYDFFAWYCHGGLIAYTDLTPGVSAWLAAYAPADSLVQASKYAADRPAWYSLASYATLGNEHPYTPPETGAGVFLARAWLAHDDAATLASYVGQPWLTSGGDWYTLQRAVETAQVYAGAASGLTIGTVTATPSGAVAAGAKLELRFAITHTVATYLDLPYDPSPPANIDGDLGITVQAEVSDDNWASYRVQPAYYHQDVTHAVHGGDWFYPAGTGGWQVRWTPPHAGPWHYRLRATDAGGMTVTSPAALTVTAATTPGLLRVSTADSRYFEYQDGTYAPLNAGGINLSSGSGDADVLSTDDPLSDTLGGVPTLTHLADQGVRWGRFWTNDWGAWGNDNNGWHQAFDPNANWYASNMRDTGHATSVKIQLGGYAPYLQRGFITNSQRAVSVKESTTYRARFRFALGDTMAPRAGGSYGLVLKWSNAFNDPTIHNGDDTNLTAYSHGAVGVFTTVTGTFTTTAGQWTLPYLWLAAENCDDAGMSDPWAYVASIQIQEDLGGGNFGPNLVDSDDMDRHRHVQPLAAARLDAALSQAEAAGFAFLWTVLDKTDYLLMVLDAVTGAVSSYGSGQYPAANTAMRWYHAAYWRYTQARWGYSPAILAWELCNEQDLGGHADAMNWAEAFADAMAGWANVHPPTTSRFQADVPGDFWLEPRWGVAHIHAYVQDNITLGATVTPYLGATAGFFATTGHTEFRDTAQAHLTVDAGIGRGGTYPLGKPVIRGEIGFVSEGHTPDEPTTEFGADTADKWLHKFVCAGAFSPGGVMDCYWHAKELITGQLGPRDATGRYQAPAALLATLPLNSGAYVPAAATTADPNLRVLGQQDDAQGRGHLWLDNTTDTWYTAVHGPSPTPVPAGTTITVTVAAAPGTVLPVTWIDPRDRTTVHTEMVTVS